MEPIQAWLVKELVGGNNVLIFRPFVLHKKQL